MKANLAANSERRRWFVLAVTVVAQFMVILDVSVNAEALGAKPPRRFPTWLARLLAGEAVVLMSTEARGASNVKAKRELGWTPRHPRWRKGFPATYSALGVADRPTPRPAAWTHSHS